MNDTITTLVLLLAIYYLWLIYYDIYRVFLFICEFVEDLFLKYLYEDME